MPYQTSSLVWKNTKENKAIRARFLTGFLMIVKGVRHQIDARGSLARFFPINCDSLYIAHCVNSQNTQAKRMNWKNFLQQLIRGLNDVWYVKCFQWETSWHKMKGKGKNDENEETFTIKQEKNSSMHQIVCPESETKFSIKKWLLFTVWLSRSPF